MTFLGWTVCKTQVGGSVENLAGNPGHPAPDMDLVKSVSI